MTGTVVDYSWSRPAPACLRASGQVGVMRYLSWDTSGKNLDASEARSLHAAGLWIGLNWEGTGNWSEFSSGARGGMRAGTEAARQAAAVGAPATVPIFVSADYGAPASHWSTIAQWLKAFRIASGRRIGFYGQGNLADWLKARGVIEWIWQTNAHGWGGVTVDAVLYQQLWTRMCGADVDPNVLAGDPTVWAWMPHRQQQEDDMTPEQARQLDQVARDAATAADQAPKAALYAAGAMRKVDIALSWLARGGIRDGLTQIYRSRLGRDPDAAGVAAWSATATQHTFEEIDRRIAASTEAQKRSA